MKIRKRFSGQSNSLCIVRYFVRCAELVNNKRSNVDLKAVFSVLEPENTKTKKKEQLLYQRRLFDF
jgi:hypothetical protein